MLITCWEFLFLVQTQAASAGASDGQFEYASELTPYPTAEAAHGARTPISATSVTNAWTGKAGVGNVNFVSWLQYADSTVATDE